MFHYCQCKAQCCPTPSSLHIQASVQPLFTAHSSVVVQGLYFFLTPHSSHPVECMLWTLCCWGSSTAAQPLSLNYTGCCAHLWTWHSTHRDSQSLLTLLSTISLLAQSVACKKITIKSLQCVPHMHSGTQGALFSWTHLPLAFYLAGSCSLYPSSISALCLYCLSSFRPLHLSCSCEGV